MAPKKKVPVIPPARTVFTTDKGLSASYKQGPKWAFYSTSPDPELVSNSKLVSLDFRLILIVVVSSLITKLWALGEPQVVVFDESHIVQHINKYIDGVYFNDVTPPLAGIFYTFVALVAGYRGDAPLRKPGEDYLLTTFPYTVLRAVTSVLGTCTCALSYLTLRSCGVRSLAAFATSLIFVFENIAVTLGRLYMPDTLFMFGVALAVYSYKKFDISEPFGKKWLKYLALTGIALGLTVSTKWIGLATIGWLLILTVIKGWYLLGDLDVSSTQIGIHAYARITAFIIVPFFIYFSIFAIHISLLTQFNNDASLLSTHFQRELVGNDVWTIPKYVTWNSTVTLRHTDSLGGYLHSHPYKYKSGSKEQQVTVFDFKDFNNEWIIQPAPNGRYDPEEPRIKNGADIMLRHKNTGAVLRVDKFKPPMSEQDYDHEVSCFGNHTYAGNETDKYNLKFKDSSLGKDAFLTATDVEFRLFNTKKRCTVLSHDIKLPEWGFNQQEVICVDSPTLSRTNFKVETVKYPKDLDYEKFPFLNEKVPEIHTSMWRKFVEVNYIMLRLLKGIKSTNKNASAGSTWPWLAKGVRFSSRPNSAIYVIGNPVTFILPLVLIPVFVILTVIQFFRGDTSRYSWNYKNQAATFAAGYLAHLLPYVLQEGEYFLQYYIPALYFGVLLAGVTLEFVFHKNPTFGYVWVGVILITAFQNFYVRAPVTWGTSWTQSACEAAKFFPGWDMRCDIYQ